MRMKIFTILHSVRRFFGAPKMYVKTDAYENIYNFTLKTWVCKEMNADAQDRVTGFCKFAFIFWIL